MSYKQIYGFDPLHLAQSSTDNFETVAYRALHKNCETFLWEIDLSNIIYRNDINYKQKSNILENKFCGI